MPVIPLLGRLRQKDLEFKASMGYIETLSKKKERKKKKAQRWGRRNTYLLQRTIGHVSPALVLDKTFLKWSTCVHAELSRI
jgi:hypothetical protein